MTDVRLMQLGNIDVSQTIAIGDHERIGVDVFFAK